MNLEEKLSRAIKIARTEYYSYDYTLDCLRVEFINDNNYTMSMSKDLILHCGIQFAKKLQIDDLVQLIIHEILHYLLNHFVRYDRNAYKNKLPFKIHNIAMDFEINQYLNSTWIRQNGMLPKNHKYPEGLSYEEYLYYLANDKDLKIPNNMPIGSIDKADDLTECETDNIEDSIKKMIELNGEREKQSHGQAQDDSGTMGISSLVSVKPKPYNWKVVLNSVICSTSEQLEFGYDYSTYTIYNRRLSSISEDIIFASNYSEKQEMFLVIGIDVSGSMGKLSQEMYARVKSLQKSVSVDLNTIIIECDTSIVKVESNFDFNKSNVDIVSGGGTDMNAIHQWIEEHIKNKSIKKPDQIIIMTDNFCTWQENKQFSRITKVLTTRISDSCPYKQYEVSID